jgi:hypothetical protein
LPLLGLPDGKAGKRKNFPIQKTVALLYSRIVMLDFVRIVHVHRTFPHLYPFTRYFTALAAYANPE